MLHHGRHFVRTTATPATQAKLTSAATFEHTDIFIYRKLD